MRQAAIDVDGITLADARHLRAVVRARTETQRVDVHSARVHVRAFDDQRTPSTLRIVEILVAGEERIREPAVTAVGTDRAGGGVRRVSDLRATDPA